jgi:hypothetical protein
MVVASVVLVAVACGGPSQEANAPSVGKNGGAASPKMACEGTTIKAGATEYCVVKTRRPYDDAKRDCERMHGHLAVFDGAGADKPLFAAIASPWGYGSGLWLGCSDSEEEGKWTCNGKPMTFSSWAPGQPDSGDALDDCAEWLADTGTWNDAPCAWELGFLCRGDATLRCDGKKLTTGKTTFCAHSEPKTWDAAKKACTDSGGTLAALANADEGSALFDALKLPSAIPSWAPEQGLWIGLSDEVEEGKFQWIGGSPLKGGNWRPGQPDNRGDEDCVTLTLTDG